MEGDSTRKSSQDPTITTHQREDFTADVSKNATSLGDAVAEQKPSLWTPSMRRLYVVMFVGYLCSTIHGFDGSLMGAINAMKPYQETFGLDSSGSTTGIIFIIYNIGQISAFPFFSWLADVHGRRTSIFVGCAIILIGTAIQSSASALSQFIAGRFLLGFGAIIAHAASPVYTVELAHPLYRGLTAGTYNNFWWIGNILAGWVTYGTNKHLTSSWAWRIPTIVQAAFPSIVAVCIYFLPESPRWLIHHDRHEEALHVFAKYHGDNDPNAPLVQLQYRQVLEEYQALGEKSRWWDYRELFRSSAARYRTFLVIAVAFFGQWSGNNVISYFMLEMIKTAGIKDPDTQLLLNAINPIFSFVASMVGSSILDKFGRRKMMLGGLLGAFISYVMLTAFTSQTGNVPSLSYGVIVFIYTFSISFACGMIPSMTLYPMECLENHTRAKGAALKFVSINVATMTNTYGVSVGLAEIGWKVYLVFITWLLIEMAVIFFSFVETKGKTLEELHAIFEAKNPRKESLKVTVVEDAQSVHKQERKES